MKRIILIIVAAMATGLVMAQPTKRRTGTPTGSQKTQVTDRAALMFPTSNSMPDDVSWRRDIYRQIELTDAKNSPLYYPVQPVNGKVNLFTYLFRLVLTGRVPAYKYNLSGVESFAEKDKIVIKEFLDRFSIYHEEKNGKIVIADADVPSEMVKRYYIKESSYLDQRTGTTHTKVQALCPIMLEGADFDAELAAPRPLFWVKYDDVASYLSKLPVMASDYNNVTNMTADDFFTLNRYKGKIYKTNNMQGRLIADYCKTDSDMVKEQKRIEQQLADFDDHLWGHKPVVADTLDSAQIDNEKPAKKAKKDSSEKKSTSSVNSRRSRNKTESKESEEAATTTEPRVSARRQRR